MSNQNEDREYLARANSRLKRMSDSVSMGQVYSSESQMQIAHIMSSVVADDFDAQAVRDRIKARLSQAGPN